MRKARTSKATIRLLLRHTLDDPSFPSSIYPATEDRVNELAMENCHESLTYPRAFESGPGRDTATSMYPLEKQNLFQL